MLFLSVCGCECAMKVSTLCSSGARALVCVDEVDAGASILAGLRLTLIDLFGAVYTMVARDTLREKMNDEQIFTILKQSNNLFIYLIFHSNIYISYLTTVASQIVSTDGSILTGIG